MKYIITKSFEELEVGCAYNLPRAMADDLIQQGIAEAPETQEAGAEARETKPAGPSEIKPVAPSQTKKKRNG